MWHYFGKDRPNPDLSAQPRGLYIHVPFCHSKCGYCDFYSVAVKDRDTFPLVRAVEKELRNRVDASTPVRTIFIGGGTPTVLPMDELESLLQCVRETVNRNPLEEFTVEANPATVDDDKARLLARSGVTRVSMGAQSFIPSELTTLERLHSPDDVAPSVAALRRAGVSQLNIDLIFGIPGQTMESWSYSLDRAIALNVDHVACYGLTYEPGTRLTAQRRNGDILPCDEHLETEMYEFTIDRLNEAGYRQYEISNFSRPGFESRHNLIYWRNEPYIGVGPSAAGCVGRRRYKNVADVSAYVSRIETDGSTEVESESLGPNERMTEMILMQLRLNEGLSIERFRAVAGKDPVLLFGDVLSRFIDQGLLTVSSTHVALTRRGRLLTNPVVVDLASCLDRSSPSASTSPRPAVRSLPVLAYPA